MYFKALEDEPEWQTIWHGFERTDEKFAAARIAMNAKWDAREYRQMGVVQHVFGSRLWLSVIDERAETSREILEDGKRYIDFLAVNNCLGPMQGEFGAIFQMGVQQGDTEEYREFVKYWKEKYTPFTSQPENP